MGFVLKYCDVCSQRIPEADLVSGAAVEWDGHTYCRDHRPAEAQQAAAQRGARPHARRAQGLHGARQSDRSTAVKTPPAGGRPSRAGARRMAPSGRRPPSSGRYGSVGASSGEHRVSLPPARKSSLGLILAIIGGIAVVILVVMIATSGDESDAPRPKERRSGPKSGGSHQPSGVNARDAERQRMVARTKAFEARIRAFRSKTAAFLSDYPDDGFYNADDLATRAGVAKPVYRLGMEISAELKGEKLGLTVSQRKLLDEGLVSLADAVAAPKLLAMTEAVRTLQKRYAFQEAVDRLEQALSGKDPDIMPRAGLRQGTHTLEQLEALSREATTALERWSAKSERQREFIRRWVGLRPEATALLDPPADRRDFEALTKMIARLDSFASEYENVPRVDFDELERTRTQLVKGVFALVLSDLRALARDPKPDMFPPLQARAKRVLDDYGADDVEQRAELERALAEVRRKLDPLSGLTSELETAITGKSWEGIFRALGAIDERRQEGASGDELRRLRALGAKAQAAARDFLRERRGKYAVEPQELWQARAHIYRYRFPEDAAVKGWLAAEGEAITPAIATRMASTVSEGAHWDLKWAVFDKAFKPFNNAGGDMPPGERRELSVTGSRLLNQLIGQLNREYPTVGTNKRRARLVRGRVDDLLSWFTTERFPEGSNARTIHDQLAQVRRNLDEIIRQ